MSSPETIYFYGDLNCPFCYVEHERLISLGLHRWLPFKGVEHWRDLPVPWDTNSPQFQESIDQELSQVAQQTSEIEIRRPPGRSNSHRALAALLSARELDPRAAVDLRTALFRALWLEGRDISDEDEVQALWRGAGLRGSAPAVTRQATSQIRMTLVEWENSPFDKRIPVLADAKDERLLGLASAKRIESFLAGLDKGGHLSGVCQRPDTDDNSRNDSDSS